MWAPLFWLLLLAGHFSRDICMNHRENISSHSFIISQASPPTVAGAQHWAFKSWSLMNAVESDCACPCSIIPSGSPPSTASWAWLTWGFAAPLCLLVQFHLLHPCCSLFPVSYRHSDTFLPLTPQYAGAQMLCIASHLSAFVLLFPLPGISSSWITAPLVMPSSHTSLGPSYVPLPETWLHSFVPCVITGPSCGCLSIYPS